MAKECAIRVLFVSDSIRERNTGVGRVALTTMRELVARGHEIIPVDWQYNEIAAEVAGCCHVVPPRLPWAKTALWHLELLRRLPPVEHDVLLNPSGYPNVLGSHPALVFYVHDLHMLTPGFYRPFKTSWFRTWYGRGLANSRLLVCPSVYTRIQLLRRYSLDADRCVVVANSLDPALARLAHELPDETTAAAGAGEEKPYLLAVGTIEDRKNVHRLAEAYARSRQLGHAVPLRVVGKRGHGSKLFLKRIAAPDLLGSVEVLDDVSDAELRRLYRGALALVFPSLEEGFGLPILEAMEAGIPVLTSRATATAEVAGDAALLVDPMDTDSIHDGIVRLLGDAALRASLSERGRVRVRDFDPAVQAQKLESLMLTSTAPPVPMVRA